MSTPKPKSLEPLIDLASSTLADIPRIALMRDLEYLQERNAYNNAIWRAGA